MLGLYHTALALAILGLLAVVAVLTSALVRRRCIRIPVDAD